MATDRLLTAEELQTAQQQSLAIANAGQQVVQPGQFVFFAAFDGTRNDRDNLPLSDTTQATNVGELETQAALANLSNLNFGSGYFAGPGTADSLPGSAIDPTQVTQEVVNIAQRAYDQFALEARVWLETNEGGSVTSIVTAFSRGGAAAVIFSQMLYERGLVIDGQVLIQPGQVGVSGGAVFDPVFTNVQGNLAWAPNVTNMVVVQAMDEYRVQFPAADLSNHPGVTVLPFLGNHGDAGGFYDNVLGSLSLGGATQLIRSFGLSIADVREGRQFDPTAPAYLHTEGVNEFGVRIWDEYGTRGNRLIAQVGVPGTVQTFDDGTSLVTFKDVRGNLIYTSLDENQQPTKTTVVLAAATPMVETFAQAIGDVTALVNAIKSGQPLPALSSGLKLLNNFDALDGIRVPYLNTTTQVVGGLASLYNLHNAFGGGGSDLGKLTATLSTIDYVNRTVPYLLSGNAATAPLSQALADTLGGTGLLNGGSAGILPGLGLIVSIKNGDPIGIATSIGTMLQGSAFLLSNPIGWVLLAASLYKAFEEPPEAWGIGTFKFGDATGLAFDVQGESFGKDRVSNMMLGNGEPATLPDGSANPAYFGGVRGYLEELIADSAQANPGLVLGLIPQRMPTLTWREARQNDPGFAIGDVDPVTGQDRYPFLRYNDDGTPYNADATDPEQRRSLFERLIVTSLAREAIAPMWEVQTAKLQQDAGDPNAGLTEVVRAAHRGLLAPVNPLTNLPSAGEFRPIALDLNGDGQITTLSNANNTRAFNWDGSGFDKQVGWVGAGEGMLFLDRNPNGLVDSGLELFSNSAVTDAAKGVRSLAWVDANGDGVLNSLDPVFAQLKVWQDSNGDAQSEALELQSLSALGISEIDYANNRFTRNGQFFSLQSPTLEASSTGQRVSVVPEGIRVVFSDGRATVYVTAVTDLGACNDGIAALEDGGQDYDGQGQPTGQASTRRDPISIATGLLLANDQVNGSNAGLVITAVGNASAGTVALDAQTGVVQYLAPWHFSGEATFEYTVTARVAANAAAWELAA